MKEQQKGIDMISELPDELLIRILSLLPAADVTRSRILSNRWKHLWAFLPNLHIVMPRLEKQADKYIDSVNQTLALRGSTPIQKLFLESYYLLNDIRVYNWVREVEVLEFRFYTSNVMFYWNMFRSCNNTLIKLTLQGLLVLLKPEVEITFPCLKKLNLQCIEYFGTNSLMVLLSRCPVLEELCMDKLGLCSNLNIVKLFSPSMRRLTIKKIEFWNMELVIDAPKLECLHLDSCYFRKYTLVKPTSLVEAYISHRWPGNVIQLLRFVSSTKILELSCESLSDFGGIRNINLPMFPNLVKLKIPWELLPSVMGLNPPKEDAPACLRFKLKEIFLVVSYETSEEKRGHFSRKTPSTGKQKDRGKTGKLAPIKQSSKQKLSINESP
ncbi:F-box/LRR-repeat protein At2g42720-like [Rutidosis leptorrhynchoides]|uniref:F-box/LRR-repeat protein At2g42720-like n=1 Tax=Rutidosis leptorrhynchoides TaxID=125765 RepID=UPI003A98D0B2